MTETEKELFYINHSILTFIRQAIDRTVRLYWQGLLLNCEIVTAADNKNIFKKDMSYPFKIKHSEECAIAKGSDIRIVYSNNCKYCLDYYDTDSKLHYYIVLPDSIVLKKTALVIYNEFQYNEELIINPEECIYQEYGKVATASNIYNDLDKYKKLVLMLENVINDTKYWTTNQKIMDNLIEYSFTSKPFNNKFGYIDISLSATPNDPDRYYFNVTYKNDYQTYTHSQTNEEYDNVYSRLSKFIDSEFFNDREPMTEWDISEDERKMLTNIMTELKEAVENRY